MAAPSLLYVWVQLEAAQAAVDVEGFVSHPLLDRINECSTRPTEALDFFSLLFWPVAEDRLLDMAPWHRYIEEVSENLEASALQKDAPTSEGVQQIGRCIYSIIQIINCMSSLM